MPEANSRPTSEWAGTPVPTKDMPPELISQYEEMAFGDYIERGAWAYDSIAEWQRATNRLIENLFDAFSTCRDTALVAAELKFTRGLAACWRRPGPGALALRHPLLVRNEQQAAALRPRLRRLGIRYRNMIADMTGEELNCAYFKATIPINHGKGWPVWIPGDQTIAAQHLAAITEEASDLDELHEELRDLTQCPIPPCLSTYWRIQASDKPRAYRFISGGQLNEAGVVLERPKVRKISALPWVYNYITCGLGGVLRWCLKRATDRNTGSVAHAIRASRQHAVTIAADLSNYDDTVAYETLEDYRLHVIAPAVAILLHRRVISRKRAKLILAVDAALNVAQLLAPPHTMGIGAVLIPTMGGVKSGERLTSQKTTDINRERIDEKNERLGIRAYSVNQGDDSLIFTDSADALRRYARDANSLGFTETIADDAAYLMRRIPDGYAYLGRMVINTLNREVRDEPRLYATSAAGIKLRGQLLLGHPRAHLYNGLIRSIGPRIAACVDISEAADLSTLLKFSALRAANAHEARAGADTAYDALQAGHITDAEYADYTVALEANVGRSNARVDELLALAVAPGAAQHASAYLRANSYVIQRQQRRERYSRGL